MLMTSLQNADQKNPSLKAFPIHKQNSAITNADSLIQLKLMRTNKIICAFLFTRALVRNGNKVRLAICNSACSILPAQSIRFMHACMFVVLSRMRGHLPKARQRESIYVCRIHCYFQVCRSAGLPLPHYWSLVLTALLKHTAKGFGSLRSVHIGNTEALGLRHQEGSPRHSHTLDVDTFHMLLNAPDTFLINDS